MYNIIIRNLKDAYLLLNSEDVFQMEFGHVWQGFVKYSVIITSITSQHESTISSNWETIPVVFSTGIWWKLCSDENYGIFSALKLWACSEFSRQRGKVEFLKLPNSWQTVCPFLNSNCKTNRPYKARTTWIGYKHCNIHRHNYCFWCTYT